MKQKGHITKVVIDKGYYEVTSKSEEKYMLFFEEMDGARYIEGDEVTFDVVETSKFGLCAINPERIGNLYLDELKVHLQNETTVTAYVFARSSYGFEASYNGYTCFCPYYETVKEGYLGEDEILNTYQEFNVSDIRGFSVYLSKMKIVEAELLVLRRKDISKIYKGYKYSGKVERVKGFGVFIKHHFSSGLLHASNITKLYHSKLDKSELRAIQDKLKLVFTEGRDVEVIVRSIDGDRFSVALNEEGDSNMEIIQELVKHGLR